jgi:hypothetical protein
MPGTAQILGRQTGRPRFAASSIPGLHFFGLTIRYGGDSLKTPSKVDFQSDCLELAQRCGDFEEAVGVTIPREAKV